jgi:hypothetical protein
MSHGKTAIPQILFHITPVERTESILSKGLVIGSEGYARFEEEEDDRKGIYLTSDWQALMTIDMSFELNKTFSIFLVNTEGMTLIRDTAYDFNTEDDLEIKDIAWYTREDVMLDRISLIGQTINGIFGCTEELLLGDRNG